MNPLQPGNQIPFKKICSLSELAETPHPLVKAIIGEEPWPGIGPQSVGYSQLSIGLKLELAAWSWKLLLPRHPHQSSKAWPDTRILARAVKEESYPAMLQYLDHALAQKTA